MKLQIKFENGTFVFEHLLRNKKWNFYVQWRTYTGVMLTPIFILRLNSISHCTNVIIFYICIADDEVKQTRIQHTQSSSYDDTATTSSEPCGETGKRSRTSSSSSAKSVASNSSKASKGSVGSSRQSSGRSSKSNLEDELIQKATHVDVTADEVVEQELLDEMVVKEVSEECGTDPGAGVVTDAKDVIREEDEGKQ